MSNGFPKHVRELIIHRALGLCEHCRKPSQQLQIHHRRPRGMGGSKDAKTNTAANGVLVCDKCHRFIESYRKEHQNIGWLVNQGKNPAEIPIWMHKAWLLLTEEGTFTPVGGS